MPLPMTTTVCMVVSVVVAIMGYVKGERWLAGGKLRSIGWVDLDGTVRVRGLWGVRIEMRKRQHVNGVVVRGTEDFSRLHGVRHKSLGSDRAALRLNYDALIGPDVGAAGVGRVDLDVNAGRIELAEDSRLAGSRLRVPLRGAAAAGE